MRLAVLALFALRASAAVLQGIVLEDETGYPLARTTVTLTPLPGTAARTLTIRTSERGAFSMLSVQPGWYLLKTSRKGFADAEQGQARAGRPGTPFEVLADTPSLFFQLRMKRLAAIEGSVLDDNGVGIADFPVHVYTGRKPVRRIAEGKTDDRGIFRVGGLEAGTYIVRSGVGTLEDDTTLVPTYYKYGGRVDQAQRVTVRYGETQRDVAIRPQTGRLFTLAGIMTAPPGGPVRMMLVTDTGRRLLTGSPGPFQATNVPPGPVELLVEGADCGAYVKLQVDRDLRDMRIGCNYLSPPRVDWQTRKVAMPRPPQYPVLIRRVDLDGATQPQALRMNDPIMPGHYELIVQTGPQHYTQAISVLGYPAQPPEAGWFGMDIGTMARISIVLSETPATISGMVGASGKPVAGAVVYLESYDPDQREPRIQLWSGRTDQNGRYAFAGLAPGRYRIISSFDFDPDNPNAMEFAKSVNVKDGETAPVDLELILR